MQQFGKPSGGYWVFDLAIVIPVIALAVVVAVRMRPSYAIYVWGSLLAPLAFVFAGRPLMSMPRFVVTLFPVTWALARATEARPLVRGAVVLGGAVALSIACVLTVNWFYLF